MASVIECTNLSIMRERSLRALSAVEAARQPARVSTLLAPPYSFARVRARGMPCSSSRSPCRQPMMTEDATAIRRAVIACAIGQVFEIFDFVIYGFFAVAIGRAFFPSTDPIASLLASFATFAVGFLMRPVGAMVIGWYGDRFGRRKALVVTIGIDGRRHRRHRADPVLCHRSDCRADPAGDLPHVPGLLHRRRMGRRGGVPGRACARRAARPDRQPATGGDRDRRDVRHVLGGDPDHAC